MQFNTKAIAADYARRTFGSNGDRLIYHIMLIIVFTTVIYTFVFAVNQHESAVEMENVSGIVKISTMMVVTILANALLKPAIVSVGRAYRGDL